MPWLSSVFLIPTLEAMNSAIEDPLFIVVVIILDSSPHTLPRRGFFLFRLSLVTLWRLPYWPDELTVSQQRILRESPLSRIIAKVGWHCVFFNFLSI